MLYSLCLVFTIIYGVTSTAIIAPVQSITQPLFNNSISTLQTSGADSEFSMKGGTGDEDLPIMSVLMNAVSALADLAHEPYRWRLQGFHVANLPDYTDIDINIQPVAPATDLEVRFAIFGIYFVVYDMIKTRKFKISDYDMYLDKEVIGRVTINNRKRPTLARRSLLGPAQSFPNQAHSVLNETATSMNVTPPIFDPGLQQYFEYLPGLADEDLLAPSMFVTLLAVLKDIAQYPELDVVKPFISGASGFKIRLQIMGMIPPRTEPPFLLYSNLIDTLRKIPDFMVKNAKFRGITILISFGDEFIGQGVLKKGIV